MSDSITEAPGDTTRWQAVLDRDHSQAAGFVYAVRSTRVYCRPGCPSRQPARTQVLFFDQPAGAIEAGFRACRRCRPDEEPVQHRLVERIRSLLDEADDGPKLSELARDAGVSPSHLLRVFKLSTGLTPHQYAAARRVDRFKAGLRSGSSVTAAMYDAGFGSSRGLYDIATRILGMQPRRYKDHGRGERISYGVVDSGLGTMIVAATSKGLCFAGWGEPASLRADLKGEFPAADLVDDAAAIEQYATGIRGYLKGEQPSNLPLDVRGTPFQLRVWAALTSIPAGQTRTYGELAEAVGKPKSAARAVGRACALNLVAPIVPCHRAVGADGNLTGYRWGMERKRALLDIEQGT